MYRSFLFYNEAEEGFLNLYRAVLSGKWSISFQKSGDPDTIDQPSVEALLSTKVIQPKRGEKEKLVELANKMQGWH